MIILQVYVKHLGYKSHKGGKAAGGLKAIKAHLKYIENRVDDMGHRVDREMFGQDGAADRKDFYELLQRQKEQGVIAHKLCISMDRKDYSEQKIDLKELARETVAAWAQKTGRQYNWIGCIHDKASNPHVHIVLAGRDRSGKEVILKPNHLEQLKRVSDNERERLYQRNMDREKLMENEPLKEFNPVKQIKKEQALASNISDKAIEKALDKAVTAIFPKIQIAKKIAMNILEEIDYER